MHQALEETSILHFKVSDGPSLRTLGGWLASWIRPGGEVFGFHNHPVWGGNPYRWNDWTAGHSTWAAALMPGLARILSTQPDSQGKECLERMIRFQTASYQDDGNYKHIGFQCGERLKFGLIHNAAPNAALAETALLGRDFLSAESMNSIREAILRNLHSTGRPVDGGCCNQEYCRIWYKILFDQAFKERRWYDEVPEDLDYMIRHFHVSGLPDEDCDGTIRSSTSDHNHFIEPAEYYGMMILPLVLAYEIYGEERFIHAAGRLCRHVIRSAWTDERGCVRFHRMYIRVNEEHKRITQPMLISGMGDTLEGIFRYSRHESDPELREFLAACLKTYRNYQHPSGFFVSATGWDCEIDVAPSSAWHAHDFRFLTLCLTISDDFWSAFHAPPSAISALVGNQAIWFERGPHWSIGDFASADVFNLHGRKDRVRFGRDLVWVGGPDALPEDSLFPSRPEFVKADEAIYRIDSSEEEILLFSIADRPVVGDHIISKS